MVISVTNLKGGVGKTTLSQNIAVAFALEERKVCIADTDYGQQTSTRWGDLRDGREPHIPVFLIDPETITEQILKLNSSYDIVVIDGTPAINELTTRILILSDFVFVPILPSINDVWALDTFLKRYKEAKMTKESLGASVEACIILNRYSDKTNLDKEILGAIEAFELPILKTKISNLVAYREAQTQGISVLEGKDKKAKLEMENLYSEIKSNISL